MPDRAILVVGCTGDIHIDRVIAVLAARCAWVFRIDIDCFPRDYRIALALSDDGWRGEIACLRTGAVLDVAAVGAVWMRKPAGFSYAGELSKQERLFADEEANHVLLGWLNSLTCFFMSHPVALRAANWKCEQLMRARRFGFDVPASMLTSDPPAARQFIRHAPGEVIYKTLSTPMLAADRVSDDERIANGLYTTVIDADDVELDRISALPALFQGYVEKAYEVRVTVVGDRIFAACIDSQADERTRVDFRHYDVDIGYRAMKLPVEVERRCRAFVGSYNLTFGALDFIVTEGGCYVFLENNPTGQFIFIEELVPELRITAAVADALIGGALR